MATTSDKIAQPPLKRPRLVVYPEPAAAAAHVELNPADCNLDFEIGGGGLRGKALHEGGSAYCWSGARATVGIRGGGRYCFGCKILAEQSVEMEDTDADQRHLCRVGVSRGDDSVCGLGVSGYSFGFEGTGKLAHHGKFFDYGMKFGVGDTIVCSVDLDSKPMASIRFSRNGERPGIAKRFDASARATFVLPLAKDMPGSMEPLDEVIFVELSRDNAQRILDYLRHSTSKHGNNVTSTSIGPVSGWQSERGSIRYETKSSLKAPDKQLIHPISAKDQPRDEVFIFFRKMDLYGEYESMDIEHKRIMELSDSGGVTQAEKDVAWDAFKARLNVCREMRREIRSARGSPPPIPDRFLT